MYREHFGAGDESVRRRHARNARLRERRLQLLRELEATAVQPAAPTDLLDGWLPPPLPEALCAAGVLTLGELQQRIARGGRWWAGLPAFGATKAARLAAFVELLLGPAPLCVAWPRLAMTAAAADDAGGELAGCPAAVAPIA